MALSAKSQREIQSQIETLLFKRDFIYQQVDTLYTLALGLTIESPDLDSFKVRLEKLEHNYTTFNKGNSDIVKLWALINNETKADDIIALKKLSTDMDTRYFYLLAAAKTLCPNENLNVSVRESRPKPAGESQVKLPAIEIPQFDGTLKDWPAFKDCFTSLIHENSSVANVLKFQYLISSTKGEVNSLVRTLPLTATNYDIVWNKLLDRYDNKRLLASHYIDEIINFENLNYESAPKLRLLIDTITDNMSAIERIGLPESLSEFVIFHLVLKKLDKRTRQLFEENYSSTDFPTLGNLKEFLSGHCKAMETALCNESKFSQNKPQTKYVAKPFSKNQPSSSYHHHKSNPNPSPNKSFVSNTAVTPSPCMYCAEDHTLPKCSVFGNLTSNERKEFARSKRICFNCLGYFHMINQCNSNNACRKCGLRHHTLLHVESKQIGPNNPSSNAPKPNSNDPSQAKRSDPALSALSNLVVPNELDENSSNRPFASNVDMLTNHASRPSETQHITILGTVKLKIQDVSGGFNLFRALIDPGSQLTFITESCVKTLGLNRQKYSSPIVGLSQTPVNNTRGIVSCTLKSKYEEQDLLTVKAVILEKITSHLPTCHLDPTIKQSLSHLNLADDDFDKPGPIDFLIGADLFPHVFDGGRLGNSTGHPTPYHSIFGWVLIGESKPKVSVTYATTLDSRPNDEDLTCNLCISDPHSLDAQLKQFWEVEEIPNKSEFVSESDAFCETHFSETHSRDPLSGRYIVKLPFREEPTLGASFDLALNRLSSLERRLEKNPDLKTPYVEFMTEYEQLGHMRLLNSADADPKYFIPHHGILKDKTKFRTVFDASAPSSNGRSLNSVLHAGPKLQRDISEILCNFRCHPIVFVADIAKMYRQLNVHPEHQPFQCILWRESPTLPPSQFILQTVTYGVTCSPFLAMRTLHQLVHDEGNNFPSAVKPIMEDMFVDDLLTGAPSLQSALKIKDDIVGLLASGGFELRKWSSNCQEFLSTIPEEDRALKSSFPTDEVDSVKVLGIKWCPSKDVFTYQVNSVEVKPTKRNILSHIARIFDILGWIAPVVIYAKILIQRLWVLGIEWDELPDVELQDEWFRFTEELPLLCNVEIPRFILAPKLKELSIHGFCDASIVAYAAVIYLRIVDENNEISVHLLTAKSRVAPLKTISLPKLELSGALLLARLLDYSKTILSAQLNRPFTIFAWSDSTIVLNWIHTSPHLLKTFTANRISTIQEKTNPSEWYYVPTDTNPADCASRGLFPQQLIDHEMWWHGPDWLHDSKEHWPTQNYNQVPLTSLPEVKQTSLKCNVANTDDSVDLSILERFSNLERLKRVTAWCLRFARNCRLKPHQRNFSELSVDELKSSLDIWIKSTQQNYFSDAIRRLTSKLPLQGTLLHLNPFIDDQGTLRVGGRLQFADVTYEKKHPILLPQQGHLSKLIVDFYHTAYFHVGPRTLQGLILRRFWIISIRKLVRRRILNCIKCTKLKACSPQPLMAPLPSFRLQQNRAFLKVGADFAGPFSTKSHRGRKPTIFKSYLCLFVCMSTKAIHLEVVSTLSTEDFLASFDRFIARRGLCSDIYTDNGTMFVGANNHLKEIFQFLSSNQDQIQRTLATKEIKWHFNPPSSPHFGGIWEAGVKSAKFHLKRVIGEQILTFEELATLFCKIESILNSRPLCALSTDPTEAEVLTPGHFLIGDSLLAAPQEDLTHIQLNRLSRWQLIQQATQHFWRRWSTEYLHTLQQRGKWTKKTPSLAIGDVVVVKESSLPPLRWPIGRILRFHPGPDGENRVAVLQMKFGQTLTRPVVKLCPLPTQD